jgi:glycosyltransferase involved in cell wall biosynthesis
MKDTFSIVITCHNTGGKIGKLLTSLTRQGITYSQFEVIIVDDASIDKSHYELINKYKEKNPDLQLKLYELPQELSCGCPSNTIQYGIDQAQNDWITIVDHDDCLTENALYSVREALKKYRESDEGKKDNSTLTCICGAYVMLTPEGKYSSPDANPVISHGKFYNRQFLVDNNIRNKPNMKTHDDLYFNSTILAFLDRKAKEEPRAYSILQLQMPLYIWTITNDSFTASLEMKDRLGDLIEALGLTHLQNAKAGYKTSIEHMVNLLFQLYFFTQRYEYTHETTEEMRALITNYLNILHTDLGLDSTTIISKLEAMPETYNQMRMYCTNFVKKLFIEQETLKEFIERYFPQ